jgi:hypothetical protein
VPACASVVVSEAIEPAERENEASRPHSRRHGCHNRHARRRIVVLAAGDLGMERFATLDVW